MTFLDFLLHDGIREGVLTLALAPLVASLLMLLAARGAYRISRYDKPGAIQMFGLGFMLGPQMLVVSTGWWHWRIEWDGEFRSHWPATRPIRKGEIARGDLAEFTEHRGLNPHVKAAKRDKYHWLNEKKPEVEGWLARLLRWFRVSKAKQGS